jgi:hypothetical protein
LEKEVKLKRSSRAECAVDCEGLASENLSNSVASDLVESLATDLALGGVGGVEVHYPMAA